MQLPIGLFGVAIATANLARVSRDAARGDHDGMRRNLAASVRAAALLTLPATFGLIALREPIVRLLFQHGRFDAEDSARTAAAVLCYALGLFAYAVTKIQVPTFYALGDTRTPVKASVTAVVLKIGANFLLIALLTRLGIDAFLGLALSTSLAAWINFGWLAAGLRRRLGAFEGERVISSCLTMLVLSLLMAVVAGLTHGALAGAFGGGGWIGEAARLGAAIVAAVAFLAAGIYALDLPESRVIFRRWQRGDDGEAG
jgi:putative peptidoglycan lipid II flippase